MTAVSLSQFWVQRLGWTLLHFLWQGTVIAAVYAVLRGLLARVLSTQGRYLLACAGLGAMIVAPPLTFLLIPNVHGAGGWTVTAAEWQRILPTVVVLWLAGVLVFSIRLIGGWRFTARLRSTSHPAPTEWQWTLERIAARVGAAQPVRLLVSSLVDVPTVMGWLRPVILVPVEFLTGLSLEHITALLAHELAHIRRHDYFASILQNIIEAVLFYHPAVWWISDQVRAERELCCDDLAVVATGDVLAYARALADLESRQPARLAPTLAANGGSLVNRVRRLIEPAHAAANNLPGPGVAWAMSLLWLAGVGMVTVHGARISAAPAVVPVRARMAAPGSLTALAAEARNTLLFDPVLSARPEQHPNRPEVESDHEVPAPELSNEGGSAERGIAMEHEPRPEQAPNLSMEAPEIALIIDPDNPKADGPLILRAMAATPPEPPLAPTFRAATKLVQVDVIARRKRVPATGLTQEDFTLFDNGKPQKIALFSVSSSQTLEPSTIHAALPLRAGAVSNRLEGDSEALANASVLLIDERNTAQADQAFALQRIRKFLRTRGNKGTKRDRIGVYTFGRDASLEVVQEVTDDAGLLSRAADNLTPRDPSYRSNNTAGMTARASEEHRLVGLAARAMDTKHVLEAIARHLASVPGRKGLIWVTSLRPDMLAVDRSPDLQETARALNDAEVALYAVDARGLVGALDGTTTLANAESAGVQPPLPIVRQMYAGAGPSFGIDAVSQLAELTGGSAMYNTNGIEDSIQKALDDSELTYTLGFYPGREEQDGAWHKLTVQVAQRGVSVRCRGKYFAAGTLDTAKDRPTLPDLLKGPLDATQLQLVAETTPDQARPDFRQVSVSVDLHQVHLENRNNTWVGAIDVSLSIEGSPTAYTIARKLEIPDRQLAAALNQGILFNDSIGIDRTSGELRIVAQDRATGAAGSVRVPLSNR